jgi:hypothetical protein
MGFDSRMNESFFTMKTLNGIFFYLSPNKKEDTSKETKEKKIVK